MVSSDNSFQAHYIGERGLNGKVEQVDLFLNEAGSIQDISEPQTSEVRDENEREDRTYRHWLTLIYHNVQSIFFSG